MLLSPSCLRVLVTERLAHADPAAYEAAVSKARGQQRRVWAVSPSGAWPELVTLLWAVAAVAPLVMLREFCRRFAFAHLRMAQALILDTVGAAIQLAALGWMGWTGHLSAVSAYAALGGASAVAGIVWLYVVHAHFTVRIDQLWAATQARRGLRRRLLAMHLPLTA